LAKELDALKLDGARFSISFEEYTSVATKRFMNLNVHFEGGFHSLGMIHVHGTMPATKAIQLVTAKLKEFGLNLDCDIIGSTTDGASVMKYLVNPEYLSLSEDQFGHKIRRPKIANLAITFHLRLFGDSGPEGSHNSE
jgi:hypothetical protein